jgi:hypothetical protein
LATRPSGAPIQERTIREDIGQPGDVVAGVAHDQDVRITGLVVPGGDQPTHDLA